MWIIDVILTVVAWSFWAAYLILVTRGVFKPEEVDLFEPVHKEENS